MATGIRRCLSGRRGDPSLAGIPGPADAISARVVSAQATGLRIAASLAALVFVMLQRYKTPELILWTTAGLLIGAVRHRVLRRGRDPRSGDQVATPTT